MVNIVMKYGSAEGNVSITGYSGYCELASCDFQTKRTINTATGTNKDREQATAAFSEISISKPRDDASGMLLYYALGQEAEEVTVVFLNTSTDGGKPFRTLTMQNVMISWHKPEHRSDGSIMERYTLNPTEISIKDQTYNQQNEETGSRTTTYDFTQQKVTS